MNLSPTILEGISLFIFLAGFIIGLGAVTVIDLHGFLGRKSTYWTEATTRTHKVTKPLIWLGIILATVGGFLYYQPYGFIYAAKIHLALNIALVLNGIFLSFYVSPYLLKREKKGKSKELLPNFLQLQITISFIVSFLGWWSALGVLIWHVVTN